MVTPQAVLDAMEMADQNNSYLAVAVRLPREETRECFFAVTPLSDKETVDLFLERLFATPSFCFRFVIAYDFIVIWHGYDFHAARKSTGHVFTPESFDRFIEEMFA